MVKLVEMAALCRIVGEPLSSFAVAIRCVDGETAAVEDVGTIRHARTCDRWSLLGRRHLYGTPCSAEEQHQKDMELPPAPPRRRRKNCHVPLLTRSRRRAEPGHALAGLQCWSILLVVRDMALSPPGWNHVHCCYCRSLSESLTSCKNEEE